MRVKVYYNIRKKCLSVMDKTTRRVITHTSSITLADVKFLVSQKGVERIRQQKRKAVVAFVEGEFVAWHTEGVNLLMHSMTPVTFNPYKHTSFVTHEAPQMRVDSCSYVAINGREVFAFEPA